MISLPKALQISKEKTTSPAVEGVPIEITDNEFIEFLDLNKISYIKAERLKSKKDGRSLPLFRIDIHDPTEAEALISQNLVCQITGILYTVEEFRSPVSVRQCFNCQSFRHSAKNCRSKQKCHICGENNFHKGCPNKGARKPKCANCKGSHGGSYKGCPEYKKQAFRQHVVNNQKAYASTVRQNTLPQPKTSNKTFSFTAE